MVWPWVSTKGPETILIVTDVIQRLELRAAVAEQHRLNLFLSSVGRRVSEVTGHRAPSVPVLSANTSSTSVLSSASIRSLL